MYTHTHTHALKYKHPSTHACTGKSWIRNLRGQKLLGLAHTFPFGRRYFFVFAEFPTATFEQCDTETPASRFSSDRNKEKNTFWIPLQFHLIALASLCHKIAEGTLDKVDYIAGEVCVPFPTRQKQWLAGIHILARGAGVCWKRTGCRAVNDAGQVGAEGRRQGEQQSAMRVVSIITLHILCVCRWATTRRA